MCVCVCSQIFYLHITEPKRTIQAIHFAGGEWLVKAISLINTYLAMYVLVKGCAEEQPGRVKASSAAQSLSSSTSLHPPLHRYQDAAVKTQNFTLPIQMPASKKLRTSLPPKTYTTDQTKVAREQKAEKVDAVNGDARYRMSRGDHLGIFEANGDPLCDIIDDGQWGCASRTSEILSISIDC